MHYLNEAHLLLFLIQMLVLLTLAKVLGELFQRRGIPALAGEILTGILLGPTILGRVWPALETRLFPHETAQATMLETVSWFGVFFLLLATGFEVNISTVWKQGKACLIIGVVGVAIPIVMGCAAFFWLPAEYWGPAATRLTFTLFLATAAAISAIPVIAKILHDLEILKSDFGLTTLSAFIVNDILGWMVFTFVLSIAAPAAGGPDLARVLFEIVLFGTVCLTIGSSVVGAITVKLQATSMPQPGTTLTFICCLGLLCGAITQWMGIHAILGFFLAGIMTGNTPEIKEKTREIISQMVHAIFVPIFFATIAIKVDFLGDFDILLVSLVTAVAVGGKFVGAWAGGKLAGLSKSDAFSIGIAHIPGGAMEIILGMLALEMKLISEPAFVAVVFAAVSSSVAVGPLLAWSIRRKRVDVGRFLRRDAICLHLQGRDRWEVIDELGGCIAKATPALDARRIIDAVRAREAIMGTGLERGIAVPHARLKELREPVIALGRSESGVDWDARDGQPAHFIFLILTPEQEDGMQAQILAGIARAMLRPGIAERVMKAPDEAAAAEALGIAFAGHEPEPVSQTA